MPGQVMVELKDSAGKVLDRGRYSIDVLRKFAEPVVDSKESGEDHGKEDKKSTYEPWWL
jgi:hypothetical protein